MHAILYLDSELKMGRYEKYIVTKIIMDFDMISLLSS